MFIGYLHSLFCESQGGLCAIWPNRALKSWEIEKNRVEDDILTFFAVSLGLHWILAWKQSVYKNTEIFAPLFPIFGELLFVACR